MDNSEKELDIKSIFVNYLILITLLLFVIIYVVLNYDVVRRGEYLKGDITKSVLLTGIAILLIYLFTTWDDSDSENSNLNPNINNLNNMNNIGLNEDISIPKFKLGQSNQVNNLNTNPISNILNNKNAEILGNNINNQDLNSKYRITNDIVIPNNSFASNNGINQSIKYNNPMPNLMAVKKNIDKLEDPNIFISQKNSLRYGIKF
jgi:hypothetical protein